MKVEEQVAGHYTRGTLEQKILEALRAAQDESARALAAAGERAQRLEVELTQARADAAALREHGDHAFQTAQEELAALRAEHEAAVQRADTLAQELAAAEHVHARVVEDQR